MRTVRIELEDIASRSNLARALWRACRGYRHRREVQAYLRHADARLDQLRRELLDESVVVGRFRTFTIHDPKRRAIHAPPFSERVLHHALMSYLDPALERKLVVDTFACRRGLGLLAAVQRARQHSRRFAWYGQLDIRGYFASVPHDGVVAMLRRHVRGAQVLRLVERIVRSFETRPGLGLPIGTLPSQHLANSYLAGADRLLLESLRVGGMVRYMDDITWWAGSKAEAKAALVALRKFLADELGLSVHRERVAPTRVGVPLLGFRILPDRLRLSRRRKRRYRQALDRWEGAYRRGDIDAFTLQRNANAAGAIVAHADARTLVQNVPTGALAASSRRRRRAKPEEYPGLFRSGFARRIRPRAAEGALGLFWTSVLARGCGARSRCGRAWTPDRCVR